MPQHQSRLLAITGRPGIGKTTLTRSLVAELEKLGCSVGGLLTPEIRGPSGRLGFKLVDLMSGKEHVLASVNSAGTLRVGRYFVDPAAGAFGAEALRRAESEADAIVIDEVGPMELRLTELRSAIIDLLIRMPKPLIATFHYRLSASDPEVYRLLRRGRLVELNENNRNEQLALVPETARWLIDEAKCNKRGQGPAIHT